MKKLLVIGFLFLINFLINAQFFLENYIDLANNNVSKGINLHIASISGIEKKTFKCQTGFLFSFPDHNKNGIDGWFINATKTLRIRKFPFKITGFYNKNSFSHFIREKNIGIYLSFRSKHFTIKIGNNSRTYKFSKKAIETFGLQDDVDTKNFEPRNTMYSFAYALKPCEDKWNLNFKFTNFDHFLFQQANNPIINSKFIYKTNSHLQLYSEILYQSAGAFNLSVNCFGFVFRTGFLWQL